MPVASKARRNKNKSQPEIKVYGNLDKDHECPITQTAKDGKYVLRHYDVHRQPDPKNPSQSIPTSDVDTSSFRYGVYSPDTYDEYVREDEAEGKVNTFNRIAGKYKVLNDPTLDENGNEIADEDEDEFEGLTKAELLAKVKELDPQPLEDELKDIEKANKTGITELLNKYSK